MPTVTVLVNLGFRYDPKLDGYVWDDILIRVKDDKYYYIRDNEPETEVTFDELCDAVFENV